MGFHYIWGILFQFGIIFSFKNKHYNFALHCIVAKTTDRVLVWTILDEPVWEGLVIKKHV